MIHFPPGHILKFIQLPNLFLFDFSFTLWLKYNLLKIMRSLSVVVDFNIVQLFHISYKEKQGENSNPNRSNPDSP